MLSHAIMFKNVCRFEIKIDAKAAIEAILTTEAI
jgi:hypothetical protein